jgi:hypothetical protein
MQPDIITLAVLGALIIAGLSSLITATYYRQRIARTTHDTWRAARTYYRHHPPTDH